MGLFPCDRHFLQKMRLTAGFFQKILMVRDAKKSELNYYGIVRFRSLLDKVGAGESRRARDA